MVNRENENINNEKVSICYDKNYEMVNKALMLCEEHVIKGDFKKAKDVCDVLISTDKNIEEAWSYKINCIYGEILNNSSEWSIENSKDIIACCKGYLNCFRSIQEFNKKAKEILLRLVFMMTEKTIKSSKKATSILEISYTLIELYYIVPHKEILEFIDKNILSIDFTNDIDVNHSIAEKFKEIEEHVKMLEEKRTNRIPNFIIPIKKPDKNLYIESCEITEDKELGYTSTILVMNFPPNIKEAKIELVYFDKNKKKIKISNKENERFINTFYCDSDLRNVGAFEITLVGLKEVSFVTAYLLDELGNYIQTKENTYFGSITDTFKDVLGSEEAATDCVLNIKERNIIDKTEKCFVAKETISSNDILEEEEKEEENIPDLIDYLYSNDSGNEIELLKEFKSNKLDNSKFGRLLIKYYEKNNKKYTKKIINGSFKGKLAEKLLSKLVIYLEDKKFEEMYINNDSKK